MRVFFLLLIYSLFVIDLESQEVIGYHSGGLNQTGDAFVHVFLQVNLSNCEYEEFLVFETPLGVRPFGLADIGYAPDGYIYGMDSFDGLYRIDLEEEGVTESWPLPFGIQYGGMIIDEQGLILLSGEDGRLATFDIYTEEFTDLGMLDDDFPYRLTLSGIAKYRDRVFGSLVSGHLVEIFLDEMRAEYVMESLNVEQSLFIYEEECGTPFYITGTNRGVLRLLDPVQDTFYNHCDLDVGTAIFTGLTSLTEYQGFPDCRDTIDLNGFTAGFDYFGEDVCGNGRAPIAHDSVEVYGAYQMDSIQIEVVEDPDIDAGTIEVGNVGGISVNGAGTSEVIAYGAVEFDDWEQWLRSVEYVSTSPDPAPGLRRIAVVGYFNEGQETDTAWAEVEVMVPEFSAGTGGEFEACPTGEWVELFEYLSGADEGGRWEPSPSDGMLELLPENSGVYRYIVDHPACGSDSSEVVLFIWPGPDVSLEGGGLICAGQTTTLGLSGEVDEVVSYWWSTGSNSPEIEVSEEGQYWLRLIYGENCSWSDTVEVLVEELMVLEDETHLCPGQSIEWRDLLIEEPGEYELTLAGAGEECDTIAFLVVAPGAYILEESEVKICPGEFYEIHGEVLTEAGAYDFVLPAEDGCDTLWTLYLEFFEVPEVIIHGPDRVCEGESVRLRATPGEELEQIEWNTGQMAVEIEVYSPGLYSLEALSLSGCRVMAEKEIGDCPSRRIYIPNAFSPNADGINDRWTIYPISTPTVVEVKIFNRWGSKVYEQISSEIEWDGTQNGEELPSGVYIYHLIVEFEDGQRELLSGEILLIR